MKTLNIDAGNGGSDTGATGYQFKEKDWNLNMSLYQYKRLKELGAKVALTRSTDETLSAKLEPLKLKRNMTSVFQTISMRSTDKHRALKRFTPFIRLESWRLISLMPYTRQQNYH